MPVGRFGNGPHPEQWRVNVARTITEAETGFK